MKVIPFCDYMIGSAKNLTIEDFYSDWEKCQSNRTINNLNSFIKKWATCPLKEVHDIMESASALLRELVEEQWSETKWKDVCEKNEILAYHCYIEMYPNSKYKPEAEMRILSLKDELLLDMKKNPSHYKREDMYSYILNGVLSFEDLVTNTNILDDRAFHHILKYPSRMDEERCLPVSNFDNPTSPDGNVDILPFGLPGSGGKTCLFASLMTLFDNKTFFLKQCDGTEYARELSRYMIDNTFPPKTDVTYMVVTETSIKTKDRWHDVSFVDFSGEKARDIALDDEKQFVSPNIGAHCYTLMNNKNKKILLFAIDLTYPKHFVIADDGSDTQYMTQDLPSLWIQRLKVDNEFCDKIIAIKIVVTKKDLFGIKSSQQAINALIDNGYKTFYDSIVELCHKYKIMPYNNYTPEVIPFSIGRIMAGCVYNFDDSDAGILLDSIRHDLEANCSNKMVSNIIRKILKY